MPVSQERILIIFFRNSLRNLDYRYSFKILFRGLANLRICFWISCIDEALIQDTFDNDFQQMF